MRYIPYDPQKICYPDRWKEKAAAALHCVAKASDDKARSQEINKPAHREIWACLKSELAKLSYGKCWYTEAPQAGTDTDVDHFRPKNAVKGVKRPGTDAEHPGYWWLAFDPSNYRYSCIVANRRRTDVETGKTGGKAAEFPIWQESCRAWSDTDRFQDEQPLLIDPCDAAEVALITFAENGEAIPRHKELDKPRLFKMADTSIKLYHLNHSDFVKARETIRDEIMKSIEDAQTFYLRLDEGDSTNARAYKRAIEQLRNACSARAPFSSFAIAILQPYRADESLEPVFL